MTDKSEKNDEKKPNLEHKVGLHEYAVAGGTVPEYVVVGAPRVRGKRWVTVSHKQGGPVAAWPEDLFEKHFWVPNPTEE